MKKIVLLLVSILLVGCKSVEKPTYRDLENQLQEQAWMYESKLDELKNEYKKEIEDITYELNSEIERQEEENRELYSKIEEYEYFLFDKDYKFDWYVLDDWAINNHLYGDTEDGTVTDFSEWKIP